MEMCTPATDYVYSSMEICTPAVVESHTKIDEKSSMEFCTPIDEEESKIRNSTKCDSFMLQTPEISNLSLESPNKKSKVSHSDPEEDLKDSGFSSPDLSRREKNSKDLH